MAERGKGKKCRDCANWKVKGSHCTYYDAIMRGVVLITDDACEDFYPKVKEKPKRHKACGYAEQGFYEAIYASGKPSFIAVKESSFRLYEEVTVEAEVFLPKEFPDEFPYEPYGFCESSLPSHEELFQRVRAEFDLFLDLEPVWKDYLAACVLLSYQQEKLRTVPYVYFVGDNESGKTVALTLLNWLCYRPMMAVTLPVADIYGYLEDSDVPGTILEDEAQGLYKDLDKAKIYKAGYKQGAVVPRTMITQSKRFIKYFRVFCFKVCAAEENPRVKGLLERFIFIQMTEGYPRKDWADLDKGDEQRLRELRNILLKWRLTTKENELPNVDLPVKGRLKELWKPVIQVVSGLTVERNLRAQLEALQKERLNEKNNTLEGHIVKVVCELFSPDQPLVFSDLWDALVKDLEGKLDDKKPNKMDTPEFGEVTKQKVGYRLREVLGGKKAKVAGHDNERVYVFESEKIKRIAKKYNCFLTSRLSNIGTASMEEDDADKWTTKTSSTNAVDPNSQIQVGENLLISQAEPDLRTKKADNQAQIPTEVVLPVLLSASSPKESMDIFQGEKANVETSYKQLVCYFCGKPLMDNDWEQSAFSENKPAHKKCCENKRVELKLQVTASNFENKGQPPEDKEVS